MKIDLKERKKKKKKEKKVERINCLKLNLLACTHVQFLTSKCTLNLTSDVRLQCTEQFAKLSVREYFPSVGVSLR